MSLESYISVARTAVYRLDLLNHGKRSLTPALTPCNSPPKTRSFLQRPRTPQQTCRKCRLTSHIWMYISVWSTTKLERIDGVLRRCRTAKARACSLTVSIEQDTNLGDSSTSTAWAPAKGEYEESMTGSSLKSTSGYSSVTTSPSYDETRSSQEGGERRQSSLGHLVEKAKAKLNRQPTGSETVVR